MAALTRDRSNSMERWTHHLFPLKAGSKAFKNGKAAIDLTSGKVVPVSATADLLEIGVFDETIDATTAEAQVNVNLGVEIEGRWWAQDGSIAPDDVGNICYGLDDQTVQLSGAGPISGRIWLVDPTDGVFVQRLDYYLVSP
jgi:hypothetical protein